VSSYFGEQVGLGAKFVSVTIWCRFITVLSMCGSLAALLLRWRDLITLVLTALGATYNIFVMVCHGLKAWDWVLRK
jgi:hypothetical protein